MPELQHMGAYTAVFKGFRAMDHMRDAAITRHQDVMDRIGENRCDGCQIDAEPANAAAL